MLLGSFRRLPVGPANVPVAHQAHAHFPIVPRIVHIDWLHWDTSKPITEYLDLEGGPTSIIDSLPHDPGLAKRMPEYWQAFVVGKLNLLKDPQHDPADLGQYLKVLKADEQADFFKEDVYRGYFLSERAKEWLEQQCPGCFTFTLLG
ncbi:hypothetical protein D3C80_509820 [compost metagenome]